MESILIKLGVLSKIRPGQTIALRDEKIIIINHDTLEGVMRYMKGEDRKTSESIISVAVDAAIEYSVLLMESVYLSVRHYDERDSLYLDNFNKRLNELGRIRNSMEASVAGISQLASTYKTDENMQEKLHTIKGNIIYHIGVIDSKIRIIHSKTKKAQ